MRENKIVEMVERVIRVEYIAEDGKKFWIEEECKKYEKSAVFAVSKELKRMHEGKLWSCDFFPNGYDDEEVEIFDIQTEKDFENLKRYIYLKLSENDVPHNEINNMFKQKKFGIDGITYGHEVIIRWSCDYCYVNTWLDGSIDGYLTCVKNTMYDTIQSYKNKGTENNAN